MNQIGLIGLGTMGQNLVLNLSDHGYSISVYNRTYEVTKNFLSDLSINKKSEITGYENIQDFINSLEKPRKVMILVKAGEAVDQIISEIMQFLDNDDVIMDFGNSFYKDSERRSEELHKAHCKFLGVGISGGEQGARNGASIMIGGDKDAFESVQKIFECLSAKDHFKKPCIGFFGNAGAGHFVKMIHNGIEYVDMQLIADFYNILKFSDKNNVQISQIFAEWNTSRSASYLLEISEKILKNPGFESISDYTEQKGTGQWASVFALENGIPALSFAQAVFSRHISAYEEMRKKLSDIYHKNIVCIYIPSMYLEQAYFAAKLIAYSQGFEMIQKASVENGWDIDLAECARVWQGGCIIRAKILVDIQKEIQKNTIISSKYFQNAIAGGIQYLREVYIECIKNQISVMGIGSIINYFDAITTVKLSSNLIAAQRDYFGAHGYKRVDQKGYFHTQWS